MTTETQGAVIDAPTTPDTVTEIALIDLSSAFCRRFWSRVQITGGCWPWTGCKIKGYGRIKFRHRQLPAHRVAFFLVTGRWPRPSALHACNNPSCVRVGPGHIYEGTPKQNTADMIRAGRAKFKPCDSSHFNIGKWRAEHMPYAGSTHPGAKLTESSVAQIKTGIAAGESGVSLAQRFGCSTHTVSNIKTGKQWRHV